MEALKAVQNRIDALSLRERGIIIGAVIVAIYFLFDIFVMQPLDVRQRNIQTNIVRINSDVVALNVQMQQRVAMNPGQQREKNLQEVQRLRQELARLDSELQQTTANLVNPQDMTRLLQMVLARTSGLQLRKVTSLGSSPLLSGNEGGLKNQPTSGDGEGDERAQDESAVSTVYRHGLQIEFEGSYFATLEYLRKLEGLEWKFFWDSIRYRVTEYPDAVSTLSLYTISLDKNWIGI